MEINKSVCESKISSALESRGLDPASSPSDADSTSQKLLHHLHASVKSTSASSKGSALNQLKGILFGVFLICSMLFGYTLCFPALPLLFIAPKYYHAWVSQVASLWFKCPIGLFELLYGIRFHFFGDALPWQTDKAIMISNHRTRLDWMFLWAFLMRQGRLADEKIILKAELKHIPCAGWAMQMFNFMFLERKWEIDESYMTSLLRRYMELKTNYQIHLFPEGTDLNPKSKKSSDRFAEKFNLTPLHYVLHPRVKGFAHIVRVLKDDADAVYDFTIAYGPLIPTSEIDLVLGRVPTDVYMHVKRYPISSIPDPANEEALGAWCVDRWMEKEKRLQLFYSQHKLFEDPRTIDQAPYTRILLATMTFWIIAICVQAYLCMTSWIAILYMIISYSSGVFITLKYGGAEKLELKLYPSKLKD